MEECCKKNLALGAPEYHQYRRPVPLKTKGSCMCNMIGVETVSRSYLKCRTAVIIHKKLPCKCSVCELLKFTRDTVSSSQAVLNSAYH